MSRNRDNRDRKRLAKGAASFMTKGVFVDLRLNGEHVSSAWANFYETYAVYGSAWDKNPDGAITP